MTAQINFLGRTYTSTLTVEQPSDSLTIIKEGMTKNLSSLQIKDMLVLKLDYKDEYIKDKVNNKIIILSKIHQIIYRLNCDKVKTIKVEEQNLSHVLAILRIIASKIKDDFYREYLLKEINKIRMVNI